MGAGFGMATEDDRSLKINQKPVSCKAYIRLSMVRRHAGSSVFINEGIIIHGCILVCFLSHWSRQDSFNKAKTSHNSSSQETQLLALNPRLDDLRHLVTVFLHEHHVTVTVDANLTQLQMLRGHASLAQELDSAPVIGSMVRRLGGQDHSRHLLQIDKLARRRVIGLNDTRGPRSGVAGDDLSHKVLLGVRHGGLKSKGNVRETVWTRGRVTEDSLLEGRAGRFQGHDGVDKVRAYIGDDPWHKTSLRVGEQNHRATDKVQQRRTGLLHGILLTGAGSKELYSRGVVGVKNGITHHASTVPLSVQRGLGPEHVMLRGGKSLLQDLSAVGFKGAIAWEPGAAAPEGLIDQVAFVALREEVGSPAASTIGFVQPVL